MLLRLSGVMLLACLVLAGTTRAADDERFKALEARLNAVEKQNAELRAGQKQQQIDGTVGKALVNKYSTSYLAPDRPDVKGIGLSFTGEFLYMKAEIGANTVAYLQPDTDFPPVNGKAKDVTTDWAPGFRLGMEYRLPYDGWNIGADYTYYRTDGDLMVRNNDFGGLVWVSFNQDFQMFDPDDIVVKSKVDFSFDRFNMELSRNSKLSDTLSVRFFGGPSLVWLENNRETKVYDFHGMAPADPYTFYKHSSESFLYGLRAGAEGEMKLKSGFSFVGKGAVSLLTGEQKVREKYGFETSPLDGIQRDETFGDTQHNFFHVVPAIEVEAGVAWEKKLLDGLNMKVFAGYQFNEYFNGSQSIDSQPIFGGAWGRTALDRPINIGLHGFVFRLKLDF